MARTLIKVIPTMTPPCSLVIASTEMISASTAHINNINERWVIMETLDFDTLVRAWSRRIDADLYDC